MVKAKRPKTQKGKRSKKRLTEATVGVTPVEKKMEEAQEDVLESQGEANQTEPPQDQLSQSSDRRSRQQTRERSRERERSVGRDLSRLRKSRRRHESLPRRSAGRRLPGDSRRRDDRRSVEWNDLVPLHKRNPQHRGARSREREQSRRRGAEIRGRTRS